ncbi:MAG: peroxide stress protein YaaA [Pseudomonadota bacterium]
MLMVISPAKKLSWAEEPKHHEISQPMFLQDANHIATKAKKLRVSALQKLMGISEKLATLNHARFQAFQPTPSPDALRPAIYTFAGDTYLGLDAASLSDADTAFGQENLLILSGLYGLLRPFDGIQPYRLEMGSSFTVKGGTKLVKFWQGKMTKTLDMMLENHTDKTIVVLASKEYASAIDAGKLTGHFLQVSFLEERDGKAKAIGFIAKRARGCMARHIIQNRIEDHRKLVDFTGMDYRFSTERSSDDHYVFVR